MSELQWLLAVGVAVILLGFVLWVAGAVSIIEELECMFHDINDCKDSFKDSFKDKGER